MIPHAEENVTGNGRPIATSKVEVEHDEISGRATMNAFSTVTALEEEYDFTMGQFIAIVVRLNMAP